MNIKAEGETETRFFNSFEEARAWDSTARIFDYMTPAPIPYVNTRKVAYVHFTSNEEPIYNIDHNTVYEPRSTAKLIADLGYDVDILTSRPWQDTKPINEANPNDYDMVFVQGSIPRIDRGVPAGDILDHYRFLAKLNRDRNFVLLIADMRLPFMQIVDIDAVDSRYKTSEYRIKAKAIVFSQNSNAHFVADNYVFCDKAFATHVPIHSHAINYLLSSTRDNIHNCAYEDVDGLYDIVYPGAARGGKRNNAIKRLLVEPSNTMKCLWSGITDEDFIENFGDIPDNLSIKKGTKLGSIINVVYNLGLTTFIPYEKEYVGMVTPRFWEASMSDAICVIDGEWPITADMHMLGARYPIAYGVDMMIDIVDHAEEPDFREEKLAIQHEVVMTKGLDMLADYKEHIVDVVECWS